MIGFWKEFPEFHFYPKGILYLLSLCLGNSKALNLSGNNRSCFEWHSIHSLYPVCHLPLFIKKIPLGRRKGRWKFKSLLGVYGFAIERCDIHQYSHRNSCYAGLFMVIRGFLHLTWYLRISFQEHSYKHPLPALSQQHWQCTVPFRRPSSNEAHSDEGSGLLYCN